MPFKVGLFGFGRTGSLVAKEIAADDSLSLSWVCRQSIPEKQFYASHSLGFDESFAPFVSIKDLNLDFIKNNPVDFIIDFSAASTCKIFHLFAQCGVKIVTAIASYTKEDLESIVRTSLKTPILASPNITLGINWLLIASGILKKIIPQADIEIVEEHFRDKIGASGTALKIAEHLNVDSRKHVNSIRVGGIVGRHEVIFGLPHQTIRLTHESISRSAFGTGAIAGAKWLMGKENGFYRMEHLVHEKFVKHLSSLVI